MTSTPTTSSSTTGCEGTLHTGLTSGHGPEANTFTVITVTYTDKGGPGGIVPLTGRAQVILQPKTKQAEFFASTGRVADGAHQRRRRRHDGGHRRRSGRRQEHRLHRGRRLRLLQAGQPDQPQRAALPRGLGGRGRHDRGPPRLADRHARGHDGDDHPDGRLAEVQDGLAAADQPAGRDARAVPRVPQARAARRLADQRELARVRRQGRRGHRRAGRDRERRPRPRARRR